MAEGNIDNSTVTSNSNKRKVFIPMDGSKHSDVALDFYVKNIYKENDDTIVTYCVHHRAKHDYSFYMKNIHKEDDEVIITYCVHHRAQNTYGSVWMPVEPHIIEHAYHEETKKGEEVCKKLRARLHTYEIPGRVILLEGGDPGHTICKKLDELGASLIVIGCRGLGTIRRTLMGSVSGYVMHHSNIPVFVCRQ